MGRTTSFSSSEKNLITFPSPDTVRGLSLADVSQKFETEGLSVRLVDTLRTTDLISDELIMASLEFGLTLHQNDKRIIGRYVDHLMRVTLRIIEDYEIRDQTVIAAAPVHDAVENHPKRLARMYYARRGYSDDIPDDPYVVREFALREIAERLGDEVAELVRILSLPPKIKGQTREQRNKIYLEHTQSIIDHSPQARAVKVVDLLDNSGDLAADHPEKQRPRDIKYVPAYILQENGLYLPDGLIVGEPRKIAIAGLRKQREAARRRLANGPPLKCIDV